MKNKVPILAISLGVLGMITIISALMFGLPIYNVWRARNGRKSRNGKSRTKS
ncbi:hypothetical protein QIU18_00725 [Capnocytophaga canimorsus]|nr:hypothetical protein [Capnocytophaga canimorsus]WGU70705.1 hypothetical protein QIU18_00725 [Capnocytophaga canimorsus]